MVDVSFSMGLESILINSTLKFHLFDTIHNLYFEEKIVPLFEKFHYPKNVIKYCLSVLQKIQKRSKTSAKHFVIQIKSENLYDRFSNGLNDHRTSVKSYIKNILSAKCKISVIKGPM